MIHLDESSGSEAHKKLNKLNYVVTDAHINAQKPEGKSTCQHATDPAARHHQSKARSRTPIRRGVPERRRNPPFRAEKQRLNARPSNSSVINFILKAESAEDEPGLLHIYIICIHFVKRSSQSIKNVLQIVLVVGERQSSSG